MSRKEVFISATSRDLGSYREVAKQALLDIGAHPVEQKNFPTDHRSLDAMLADRLDPCDAVLHIVGFTYGGEPKHETGRPRRSYTQWEYHRAFHGRQPKPIYVFLAREDCYFDESEPEEQEKQCLQREHREHLQQTGRVYYEFSTKEELRDLIHRSDELRALVGPRMARMPLRPLGEKFTGRQAILEQLEGALTTGGHLPSQPVVIHADGGVGKTALAIEVGWRLYEAGRFRVVLFLNASLPETLDADLALASETVLAHPEGEGDKQSMRRDAVLSWLVNPQNAERTLLILDNADAPEAREAVRLLLPKVPQCAVLITSRHAAWGNMHGLELDMFTPEEALAYLRSRLDPALLAKTGDEAALDGIAKAMDHLPLGLELVVSYLHETHQSPVEWLAEWGASPVPTLQYHDPDTVGYPVSLSRVWDKSIARLSPLALGFLGTFASLAPRPAALPLEGIQKQKDWPVTRGALAELAKTSLISWPQGVDAVSIHRVLQAYLLNGMSGEERQMSLEGALRIVEVIIPAPEYEKARWRLWAQVESHIRELIRHLGAFPLEIDARAVFSPYAAWLYYSARYGDAEWLLRQTVAMAEKQSGPDHPEVASELTGLSSVLIARNRMAEAEAMCRRAMAIFETSAERDHQHLPNCLSNLAHVLAATNRQADAPVLFQRALSLFEKSRGPEHSETIACIHNLATSYVAVGRRAEAEPHFRQVLGLWEKTLGSEHPNVAACLNEIGELARTAKCFSEAEPLYRRALAILKASYGEEHPQVASCMNNLALTLGALDQTAEAQDLFLRALSTDMKIFGKEDPKIANRLGNLAWLLRRTGQLTKAEPLSRRAVEILLKFQARTGHKYSSWESTLDRYCGLLLDMGYSEEEINKRCDEIVEKVNLG